MAVAVLVCVAAAALVVALRVHAVGGGPVAELARRGVLVTAEVELTGDPRVLPRGDGGFRGERVVAEATVVRVESGAQRGRLAVRAPVVMFGSGAGWTGLLPSQRLAVRARLAPADPGELRAATLLVRGPPRVLSPPSGVQAAAGELREGLRRAAGVLPPDQRGLLPGLAVGDVSRMDPQVKADFEDAGLGHLTAVSGANLAIVTAAVMGLSRVAGLPLAVRAVLAGIAMVAFAIVARPSPSVLRALFMGLIAALALGSGRARDGVAALSVAVLGLVLFDPELARSYGFALSVSATAGILLLTPRWRDRMARRMPGPLAEATAVTAAAQAAVTPLLVLLSGQLSLVTVPANLLAGPAVPPATVLGCVAALVAPVHLGTAELLVRPAGLATGWIILVAERAAATPMGAVPWPGGPAGLALLAVAAAVLLAAARRPYGRRVVAALACGGLVAALAVGPVVAPWPPPRWLLVACDVGQGDALAIAAGPGRAVVVDTGPDPVAVDRCLRDLGVEQVPLLVLTHPHADHIGGLDGVFRRREVGEAVVAVVDAGVPGVARLSADLAARGVRERRVAPGTQWRLGPCEITVLAPYAGRAATGPTESARVNNASLVLHVRWAAGSALLGGDIEPEAQGDLLRHGLPPADVLKVPHHGSQRQNPAFLSATGARAALISVGADNDYGHPAPATIARLSWQGTRAYRTDRDGDLAVLDLGGHLAVLPRGSPEHR
ncbi:competence protein ComEC [Thermocatellispora tengchongensis]|uniref:Competence protein ComEC n=1 Tax=Thermocatellispora tengchongensis TaxID=1073253 RepID=A0A840P3K3_9ACTN|nr:ComEC/Rec2 family competence protein [Thermocatellispora tengchongensis]MBB5133086.1 competence protein ComEC [Thermocatellispora tengchongensis]